MKVLKKIFSVILISSLLFNASGVCAAAVSDENNSCTALMYELGIFKDSYDVETGAEFVTRGEAALIFAGFYNTDINSGAFEGLPFADIKSDSKYAAAIGMVSGLGMMNGYEDGSFGAEEYLTVEQAVKVMVELLGLRVYANAEGGFPSGYFNVAQKQKLLKGINKSASDTMSLEELAKLIYNSFDADCMQQIGFGSNIKYSGSQSLLEAYFDIYETKGTVEANEYTGLFGRDKAEKGFIRINGTSFEAEDEFAELLGFKVRAYYKKDRDMSHGKILYAEKTDGRIIEVDAENISEKTTKSEFIYYENGFEKSVKIDTGTSVILNGIKRSFYKDSDLKPKSGRVELIDSECDGKYETVKISYYIDYWIDHVYDEKGIRYVFDKREGIAPLKLSINDSENCTINILDRNKDFQNMTENTVLSVYADNLDTETGQFSGNMTLCNIYMSTKFRSVTAAQLKKDSIVTADGVEYKYSKAFDKSKNEIKVGKLVKLILNYYDEIVGTEEDQNYIYGFLTGVSEDTFGSECELKIFTENGEFKVYKITDKLSIDESGVKCKNIRGRLMASGSEYKARTGINMRNAKGCEQLLRLYLDDYGKLKAIDTIMPDGSEESLSIRYNYDKQASEYKVSCSVWQGLIRFLKGDKAQFALGVNASSICFYLPDDAGSLDSYSVRALTGGTHVFDNSVTFFDAVDMDLIPVMVEYGSRLSLNVEDDETINAMIISNIESVLSPEGDVITNIRGANLRNGQMLERSLKSESIIDGLNLEPGDLIGWTEDANKKITFAKKFMGVPNADGSISDEGSVLNSGKTSNSTGITEGYIFAVPLEKNSEYWKFTEDYSRYLSDGYSYMQLLSPLKHCFIFDSGERGDNPITKGSVDGLKTAEEFGIDEADRVLILIYEYRIYGLMIYR